MNPADNPDEPLCIVCTAATGLYKFKCCRQWFCSANCFQQHQCVKEEGEVEAATAPHDPDEEELAEDEQQRLMGSPEVREWLGSKKLRDALRDVDSAPDRVKTLAGYLTEVEFVEFTDTLMSVINGSACPAPAASPDGSASPPRTESGPPAS